LGPRQRAKCNPPAFIGLAGLRDIEIGFKFLKIIRSMLTGGQRIHECSFCGLTAGENSCQGFVARIFPYFSAMIKRHIISYHRDFQLQSVNTAR
jgi:hypothetical protein